MNCYFSIFQTQDYFSKCDNNSYSTQVHLLKCLFKFPEHLQATKNIQNLHWHSNFLTVRVLALDDSLSAFSPEVLAQPTVQMMRV